MGEDIMESVDLQRKGKELASQLDNYIKSHFQQLVGQFASCFLKYCDKIYRMQQQGEKGAIAYIHFSILRTNMILGIHEIRMDAYDENWYLDTVECSSSYPVGEIYCYLEEYKNLIEELRCKSIGMISLAEAQKRVFEESYLYQMFVAEVIRVGMRSVIETETYQKIKRSCCFCVCIGGYMDRFDILYKEDERKKDVKEVKRYLQSGEQIRFSYEIYKNLDLSRGSYEGLEFQFSNFAGCDFTGSSWKKSHLLFCDFQKTILKDTKMDKTKIFDTDFSCAILENVSFAGAKLKHISFEGAKLVGVDFTKAIMADEISFQDALIVECKLPESR